MRWLRHELVQTGLPVFHPQKGQDPHLLAFLLVMATLMLTCLSIPIGHGSSQRQYQALLAIYHQRQDAGKRHPGGYGEPDPCYGWFERQVHPALLHPTLLILTQTGTFWRSTPRGAAQVPEGYENAGRVVANSNSQKDSYFTDGGFEMVGRRPHHHRNRQPGADP